VTGGRQTRFVTVRGTKKEAEAKLSELLAAVNKGSYVEPSKLTVAEHMRARRPMDRKRRHQPKDG